MPWQFESALSSVSWPAISAPPAALKLALLHQLEHSQWLPQQRLQELQRRQLALVLAHAHATVPYYRDLWRRCPTPDQLEQLPLLSRLALQDRYEALQSEDVPAEHGTVAESRTSGSTGAPVRIVKTQLAQLFWAAVTLREHLWHRRDLGGKLAAIRSTATGARASNWGPATAGVAQTGPAVGLGLENDVDAQLAWLQRERPEYLLTYPSNAGELARTCLRRAIALPGLREVRTMGEPVSPELRRVCREAWSVPVVDMYSAEEVGYLALQCPESENYHVQSEKVIVEVLDERGRACAPGDTGRVVVTELHNFAMPLVRYELGDFAEVAPPCRCGRGLPALSRILGRARNMLVTADGKRYFPMFSTRSMPHLELIRQHQFVQKSFSLIEGRLVTAAPLTREQEEALRRHWRSHLPAGFEVRFSYVEALPRSPSGKFEDFVCQIS